MRQQELIEAFLNGATLGKARSLSIDGDQLIHYNTAIAERLGDQTTLNYTRYSLAIGKVQEIMTDTADNAKLIYASGAPSDTRRALRDHLLSHDTGDNLEPKDWIMKIAHGKFGEGYVIEVDDGTIKCLFGKQEKALLYPLVFGSGMVKIIEDRL